MKKTQRIPIIFIVVLLFSTIIFTFSYASEDSESNIFNSNIKIDFECMDTEQLINPKSSADSINIIKTAEILYGNVRDVMVVGSLAYVVDTEDGLEISDISDATTPIKLGQFHDGGVPVGVYVSGLYAYVADYKDGLEIIDISDPTAPVKVGQYKDSAASIDVFFSW